MPAVREGTRGGSLGVRRRQSIPWIEPLPRLKSEVIVSAVSPSCARIASDGRRQFERSGEKLRNAGDDRLTRSGDLLPGEIDRVDLGRLRALHQATNAENVDAEQSHPFGSRFPSGRCFRSRSDRNIADQLVARCHEAQRHVFPTRACGENRGVFGRSEGCLSGERREKSCRSRWGRVVLPRRDESRSYMR